MTSERSLSRTQAARCESAATTRCRCRCGGALHGANRIAEDEFDQLPATDPHKVKRAARKRVGTASSPAVPTPLFAAGKLSI